MSRSSVLAVALCLAACRAPAGETYSLVVLKAGSAEGVGADELSAAAKGHMENITRLTEEGKLLVAGPLGEPRSDLDARGIFIFDSGDLDEVRAWTGTDPAVQAGLFTFDVQLMVSGDRLRDIHPLDQAAQAAREADPDVPDAWQGRLYVLARVEERALLDGQPVIFRGTLQPGGETLAVLDYDDYKEARAQLAEQDCAMDAWYATAVLPQLIEGH